MVVGGIATLHGLGSEACTIQATQVHLKVT